MKNQDNISFATNKTTTFKDNTTLVNNKKSYPTSK